GPVGSAGKAVDSSRYGPERTAVPGRQVNPTTAATASTPPAAVSASSRPRGHRTASTPQPVATTTARNTARVAAAGTVSPAGAKIRNAGTAATIVRAPHSSA